MKGRRRTTLSAWPWGRRPSVAKEWKVRTGSPGRCLHDVEEIVAVVLRGRGIPDQVGWISVRLAILAAKCRYPFL